jgi:glycine/D-amino acid oxidase-like deaminating enzyme
MPEGSTTADGAAPSIGRLRSGHGPWRQDGQPGWDRLPDSIRADVVIVGAGITGSLLAQHVTAMGREVVVVDRLAPGQGSTAASTAMLQWEIDRKLSELADLYGFERAAEAYRLSMGAVTGLGELVETNGIACDWRWRNAIMLSAPDDDGAGLKTEFAARQRAGLPGELIEGAAAVRERLGLYRSAAIVSPGAAEADPVKLSHSALTLAKAGGARLIQDEVVHYDLGPRRATLGLAGGREIEAANLVLATGYTLPSFIDAPAHQASASWAAVTPPGMALGFWPGQSLIWDDDDPYLYLRTTSDDRILIGGEDERIDDPAERAAAGPAKAARMHAKLEALWGMKLPAFESVWSAAFGETSDGLPLIGPVPGCPHVLAAYGYGGNGITYSYLASRMIGALLRGERRDWFERFALDRAAG